MLISFKIETIKDKIEIVRYKSYLQTRQEVKKSKYKY